MPADRTYLTSEDVQTWVDEVAASIDDSEEAHRKEDELWGRVLKAISEGNCEDPSACAAVALKTEDIDFARWYA